MGGWGSESDGVGNATWYGRGGGGVYRYRGCLASRVTLEIPLSPFYVRHRENAFRLHCLIRTMYTHWVATHFKCACVCATIINRKCSLSMYNEYNADARDRECLTS